MTIPGKVEVWEKVTPSTNRIIVPGGWIYRVSFPYPSDGYGVVFVPAPKADVPFGEIYISEGQ